MTPPPRWSKSGPALWAAVVPLVALLAGCPAEDRVPVRVPIPVPVVVEPPEPDAWLINARPLSLPLVDPEIVVFKRARKLQLLAAGELVRIFPVGLGFNPDADKEVEGDGATPLGEFYATVKNPRSRYYRSIGISYPNAEDADRALAEGLIDEAVHRKIHSAIARGRKPPQHTGLGGELYIHGHGSLFDWTLGCVALDDADMQVLFDAVEVGTPIHIRP